MELTATIVAAIATAALAIVGALALFQGRSMLRAASDEATATVDLVLETRKDRDLQWQPIPSVHWPHDVVGSVGDSPWIEVKNSGGGPAISLRYVGKGQGDGPNKCMSSAIDIPSGITEKIHANHQLDSTVSVMLSTWTGEDGFNHNSESIGAIFTKDVLGFRYRFLVVRDSRGQPIIELAERWRPGEVPTPSWAKCRDIWPDYGSN